MGPPRGLIWALLALLLAAGTSCSGTKQDGAPTVLLVGVDGFEWNVLLPLLRAGELPTLARLMERGSYGEIETLRPTLSPIIWTSIATGKRRSKHGIDNFYHPGKGSRERRLLTNRDRRTKALWNIVSDYGHTVACIGWWLTFPVERVRGTMVAQTNTRTQIQTRVGVTTRKGTLLRGLRGQVFPEEEQNRVMEIAGEVDAGLETLTREVFGEFPHPLGELGGLLWEHTLWSFRADVIYRRVAVDLLSRGSYDLVMVYFGGPDVVGHRFWRFLFPEEFEHPPGPAEMAKFSRIIPDYYRFIDAAIGSILERLPRGTTVFVVSDHGMHATFRGRRFVSVQKPEDALSGGHGNAPPGVLIAAGRNVRRMDADHPREGTGIEPRVLVTLGSVLDLAPTILALEGVPIGEDMDGRVLEELLTDEFLDAGPPGHVATHDEPGWRAGRFLEGTEREFEAERLEQLRALGYVE